MFMPILEHVSHGQGGVYLRELRSDPVVFGKLAPLLAAAEVGGPRTYRYDGLGRVSPTTLRYAKVASDGETGPNDLTVVRKLS